MAVARETGLEPPEVWVGAIGRWTQRSRVNAALKSPAARVESLAWKSDRWDVQGWLYLPPEEAWPGKRPLVVTVHGGPASSAQNEFDPKVLLLVSQGYAVLAPNPRGSFGQGEAFTRATPPETGTRYSSALHQLSSPEPCAPVTANAVPSGLHSYS